MGAQAKNFAEAYRALPGNEAFASLSDDDVVEFSQQHDHDFKAMWGAANNEDVFAEQHPQIGAINKLAGPGNWLNENVLGPVVGSVNSFFDNVYDGMPQFAKDAWNVAKYTPLPINTGVMSTAKKFFEVVADSEKRLEQKQVSRTGPDWQKKIAGAGASLLSDLQELNPIPTSPGEAIVSGALMGAMELPGMAIRAAGPEQVRTGFKFLAKGLPGADIAFKEQELFEKTRKDALVAEEQRKAAMETFRKEQTEQRIQVEQEKTRIESAERNIKESKYINFHELTGKMLPTDSLDEPVIGRDIHASIYVKSPWSMAYEEAAPLKAERNAIYQELATLPGKDIWDIKEAFKELKSEISSTVETPADKAVGAILSKYVDIPRWKELTFEQRQALEAPLPSYTGAPDRVMGTTHDPTTIHPTTLYKDATALGELAYVTKDAGAKAVYEKAQQILRDQLSTETKRITDNKGLTLDQRIKNDRRAWNTWYQKHDNDFIASFRHTLPSEVNGAIFRNVESINAYKNAVYDEQWQRVRNNKINEIANSVFMSEEPSKALAAAQKHTGYLESFMTEPELNSLRGIVSDAEQLAQLRKDSLAIEEEAAKKAKEFRLRRKEDLEEEIQDRRRANRPTGQEGLSLALTKENVLTAGAAVGAGATLVGILAWRHPLVAEVAGALAVADVTARKLGYWYLKSPEVRAQLLEAGASGSPIEAMKVAAQIHMLILAKEAKEESDKRASEKK